MDRQDWIFLALGGLLGFVVSIAASVLNNRILNFLADRKLLAQPNRFAKAAKFHKRMSELHSGARDKYFYAMNLIGLTIVSFIFSIGLVIMSVALPVSNDVHGNIARYALLSGGLLALFIAFQLLRSSRTVGNAIDRFADFDAQFKQRWANHLRLTHSDAETQAAQAPGLQAEAPATPSERHIHSDAELV
jgi:hypothetical protein